jgi:hypothetical protein
MLRIAKVSSSIKPDATAAGGRADTRNLTFQKKNKNGIVEGWNRFAHSFFKQTETIHSSFDVRRSSVSFSIKLDTPATSGGAEPVDSCLFVYINLTGCFA